MFGSIPAPVTVHFSVITALKNIVKWYIVHWSSSECECNGEIQLQGRQRNIGKSADKRNIRLIARGSEQMFPRQATSRVSRLPSRLYNRSFDQHRFLILSGTCISVNPAWIIAIIALWVLLNGSIRLIVLRLLSATLKVAWWVSKGENRQEFKPFDPLELAIATI